MVSEPLRSPVTVGENATPTTQLAATARLEPGKQELGPGTMEKSSVVAMEEIVRSPVPLLDSVTTSRRAGRSNKISTK
jgi:hypothetical protein